MKVTRSLENKDEEIGCLDIHSTPAISGYSTEFKLSQNVQGWGAAPARREGESSRVSGPRAFVFRESYHPLPRTPWMEKLSANSENKEQLWKRVCDGWHKDSRLPTNSKFSSKSRTYAK